MKVVIIGHNPSNVYSGGRYHSWMMAEALSFAGFEVWYITDNLPVFIDDFKMFPSHNRIRVFRTKSWNRIPEVRADWVIIVPTICQRVGFYINALNYARKIRAKVILLNFETPNWFNSLSPVKVDSRLWDGWKLVSEYATIILSSSREGNKYAREFYNSTREDSGFEYCYPSINNIVADKVKNIKTKKSIVLITRFGNSYHKGGYNLPRLLDESMSGYTLNLLLGSGAIPDSISNEMTGLCKKYNIKLIVHKKVNDYEKFRIIKSSLLMIFPSFFEGFGYPPIESQYCDVPCVVFDLPVLREVSGESLIYAERGNWEEFGLRVREFLKGNIVLSGLRDNVFSIATLSSYSGRLVNILSRYQDVGYVPINIRRRKYFYGGGNNGILREKLFRMLFSLYRRVGFLQEQVLKRLHLKV